MKKVIFILTFVLISGLSFANGGNIKTYNAKETALNLLKSISYDSAKLTKNVKTFGTCYVTISFYGEDGENLGTHTLAFENVSSQEECEGIADDIAELLE